MSETATATEARAEPLSVVDKSDLAGLIARSDQLEGHFSENTYRLEKLVSGLAGDPGSDEAKAATPRSAGLAGLADAFDRMDQTHSRTIALIDRLNSLIAL